MALMALTWTGNSLVQEEANHGINRDSHFYARFNLIHHHHYEEINYAYSCFVM